MPRVTDDQLAVIKSQCDLVDLFSEITAVKRSGSGHVALCPFHMERTPSCHLYPENRYHCFGCGANGDPIDFVMHRHKISDFQGAVSWLARRYGLDVVLETEVSERLVAMKLLLAVVETVAAYAHTCLMTDLVARPALDYLTITRGIPRTLLQEFQVGFIPAGEALWSILMEHGFTAHDLISAGVAYQGAGHSTMLTFSERIIFPLCNRRRQVCGFSARILPGSLSEKKYINSAESLVFRKAECLFGLREVKARTGRTHAVALTEGPLDVLAFAHVGIPGLSSCGTAWSRTQGVLVGHQGLRPVIALDADRGGEAGVPKLIGTLLACGLMPGVAHAPEGKDPGDLMEQPLVLQSMVEDADDWLHVLQRSYDERHPQDDPIGRSDRFLPVLRPMPDSDRRAFAADRVDRLVGISVGTTMARMRRQESADLHRSSSSSQPQPQGPSSAAPTVAVATGSDAWICVRLLVHHPALRTQVSVAPTAQPMINAVIDLLRTHTSVGAQLRRDLQGPNWSALPTAITDAVMESLLHDQFCDLTPMEAQYQLTYTVERLAQPPRGSRYRCAVSVNGRP